MRGSRLLMLFVQGFGRYNGPNQPVRFPSSPTNRMARFCFRLLGPAVRRGQVILAAETEGMRGELEQFSGLPVKLFPHPVPPPEELPPPAAARSPFLLTAPGFARHEKGSDLLRYAIEELLAEDNPEGIEFVLQWPEPFAMPDGLPLGPGEKLKADPRVRLVNENLDPNAYEKLIAESGAVLLPYRRNSYQNRLSRVAIEAAGRGKPLVYTTGTWTEEVAAIAGTGVPVREESVRALVEAMREAIGRRDALETEAREGAAAVASFHTAETFRTQLLEVMKK
jgi:glycosyltransferase involved in cell wall biosynthesis